jgi:hypothetical protein
MNGVESSTHAAGMVRALVGREGVLPAQGIRQGSTDPLDVGALTSTREAVKEALSNTGFVDVTGSAQENFEVYLSRQPIEMAIEDLKPGLLNDLTSWVASQIAAHSQGALDAQAGLPPEAAVKLLT